MKIIMDNYTEIQDVKKLINEKCESVIKTVNKEFKEQRVEILKQIDAYVKDIDKQLKGTKTINNTDWSFCNRDWGRCGDTYPSYISLTFNSQYNTIKYDITLPSSYSGEKGVSCRIVDGHLSLDTTHPYYLEKTWQYEHELVKAWKDLKKNINDRIMDDFTKSQKIVNDRLNNAQIKKDLYDNFEV